MLHTSPHTSACPSPGPPVPGLCLPPARGGAGQSDGCAGLLSGGLLEKPGPLPCGIRGSPQATMEVVTGPRQFRYVHVSQRTRCLPETRLQAWGTSGVFSLCAGSLWQLAPHEDHQGRDMYVYTRAHARS